MKQLITRIKSALKTLAPLVAFALLCSNFIVSCCVVRSSRPRYFYNTLVVTNELLTVVSNVLSATYQPTNHVSFSGVSRSSETVPRSQRVNYRYSVVGGKPVVYMHNRYYYEGDITSRGIILRIFPDRIYLHDGFYIENSEGRISDLPKTKARLDNE